MTKKNAFAVEWLRENTDKYFCETDLTFSKVKWAEDFGLAMWNASRDETIEEVLALVERLNPHQGPLGYQAFCDEVFDKIKSLKEKA